MLGLGLDGHANHRLGEGDRFEHDRPLLVAQRVAGDGTFRADNRGDLARLALGDVLALVGVQLHQAADALALVAGRVVGVRARLERARVDPNERQLANEASVTILNASAQNGSARIG